MTTNSPLHLDTGLPYPFGATHTEMGVNFTLVSKEAKTVTLCFFNPQETSPWKELPLNPETHKTGNVWHILVRGLNNDTLYAYKIQSNFSEENSSSDQFLMDPYAKAVATGNYWSDFNPLPYLPLAPIPSHETFDWENILSPHHTTNELIIYEMHVRGFTQHLSSTVTYPGTFLGVIEKIPHLLDLGVNAVELLPIQEFNEMEYFLAHPYATKPYCNFWGYSTVNFFAPMRRYATSSAQGSPSYQFKTMVRELHRHGIEVILDVVFNHTAEGNENGPILSYKGIDNATYYLLNPQGHYSNYSGCGNTLNSNHPQVIEWIINCLRYWTTEMHVDGFRFDLASALTRNSQGIPLTYAPLIQAITTDPILANTKLIAEPWDAAGLYQVGNFAPQSSRWSEWNGKYRDAVRRFIRGTPGSKGEFATRLCGSEDLYSHRGPLSSLNFITSHDGFTLADLVSYNQKHNLNNNEKNQDGTNDNESWNCGKEGPTTDSIVIQLRERQMRNFHLALMLSQGIPMLFMGDEYGHTKHGNNNTWCHDTELNWFLWDKLENNQDFYRFYRLLINFRKQHPILKQENFLTPTDIDWHGNDPFKPNWNSSDLVLAFTLKDKNTHQDLYIAFNASNTQKIMIIPTPPTEKKWHIIVDTAAAPPKDFSEEADAPPLANPNFQLNSHSAILLKAF